MSIGRNSFIWSHNALITFKNLTFEQYTDPPSQICLHKLLVVLFNFGECIFHVSLLKGILNPVHDLSNDEIFIDKDKEEAFKKGVAPQIVILGHSDKDLTHEFAEKLSFV